jgi:bifunctional non-homologous end joining protein LigD
VSRIRRVVAAQTLPKAPAKAAARGSAIASRIKEIEESAGDGILDLGSQGKLQVSSLGKVFFPKDGITKGDLMSYYASVAPYILPAIADRPLVLKRFPNGIADHSFYQQRAGDAVPAGVRVETIENDQGEKQRRFIGGDLLTLLYTIQLAGISVDPWHSRIGSLDFADYTIIDLDPGPRAKFARVIEVARWCRDVIDAYQLEAAIKTSGSSGLHIYIPLPPRTPTEAATIVAQVIATTVADSHPRVATVERSVKSRGAATVYVDYLQNIKGKTIAGAYCVRARPGAPVSTPLKWNELDGRIDPRDFTIRNVAARVKKMGDIWATAMRRTNSLKALLGRAKD